MVSFTRNFKSFESDLKSFYDDKRIIQLAYKTRLQKKIADIDIRIDGDFSSHNVMEESNTYFKILKEIEKLKSMDPAHMQYIHPGSSGY